MKLKIFFLFILLINSLTSYEQVYDWAWAKSASGDGTEQSNSITTDNIGNVYITGKFGTPAITFDTISLINVSSGSDIFITKYDALGNVLWAKRAGGINSDESNAIITDNLGNIYITGEFVSPTITFDTITITNSGLTNIFIAKYDTFGNVLWAKGIGGHFSDYSKSVAVDNIGNVYITGVISSLVPFGTTILTNAGGGDVFLAKYDASGNVQWAKSAGGNYVERGFGITTDNFGNIYITGEFCSPTITFGSNILTKLGQNDIFITKYDTFGNVLWAKRMGGSKSEMCYGVATDNIGNVYITGQFRSSTIALGTISLTNSGNNTDDIFIIKYDAFGNVLWAKSAGGVHSDQSNSVAIDNSDNIYITGAFYNSITFENITLTSTSILGDANIYVAKYDAFGNVLWVKTANGVAEDFSNSITVDPFDNVYITGRSSAPIIFGSIILNDANKIFVAKLSPCNIPPPTITVNGATTFCTGDSIMLTSSPATSYLWSNSEITQSITLQTAGLYWVEITDTNGCTARDSIIVNILPKPVVNLGNDTIICTDIIAPLILNAGNIGSTYLWNTGLTTQSISVSSSGTYSVIVTGANTCKNTDTITVMFKPALHVNLGNDSIMCPGDLITLSAGVGYESYLWSDGSALANLNISIPGIYSIIVTKEGCTARDEVKIRECNSEIWFPNAFSPNGDGLNDFFYPIYSNIDNKTLTIFNRWGNKIYEGSGKSAVWDGKYLGELSPEGVYYYILDYEEKGDGKRINKQLHGSVTLLR